MRRSGRGGKGRTRAQQRKEEGDEETRWRALKSIIQRGLRGEKDEPCEVLLLPFFFLLLVALFLFFAAGVHRWRGKWLKRSLEPWRRAKKEPGKEDKKGRNTSKRVEKWRGWYESSSFFGFYGNEIYHGFERALHARLPYNRYGIYPARY